MTPNKSLKDLPACQTDLNSRIFDLVIGRVLRRIYLDLNNEDRERLEKTFLSDNQKGKEEFIKKNITKFKIFFKEETKKIEKEINTEIEK